MVIQPTCVNPESSTDRLRKVAGNHPGALGKRGTPALLGKGWPLFSRRVAEKIACKDF